MNMTESCNEIIELCNKINAEMPMTLEEIPSRMEMIREQMLWDKVCSIEKKMDKILKLLGDKYAEK